MKSPIHEELHAGTFKADIADAFKTKSFKVSWVLANLLSWALNFIKLSS